MGMGGGQGMGGGMGGGMMGGGMGGMGMGGGGMGMGGGMFNIPAGRDGMLKVGTLCLEHGKPDPTPHMNYVIRPLSELNSDPKIEMLCRMLANDQVNQGVAQAAAWNMANDLPWNKLVTMNRVELMDGYFERYFSQQQVMMAQRLVQGITQQVAKDAASGEQSKSDDQSRYSDESKAGK
jgi:hypothetical protein